MKKAKRWIAAVLAFLLMSSMMDYQNLTVRAEVAASTLFRESEDVTVQTNVKGGKLKENGILLSAEKDGATISFDRVFSGTFDLYFDVLPTVEEEVDFRYLTFTFTDADNPEQQFQVRYDGKPYWGVHYSKLAVLLEGQQPMGRDQDASDTVTADGTVMGGSFSGLHPDALNFIFRAGDMGVYRRAGNNLYCCLDLDDASMVGEENVLNGFRQYTVSVTMSGFSDEASIARVLLYSISGQKLGGESLTNTAGPETCARVVSKGVTGYAYSVPTPAVSDVIDGEIPFKGTIRVLDPRNRNVYSSKTGTFFPKEVGEYMVEYIAADKNGKKGPVCRVPIQVVESPKAIEMELESLMPGTVALADELMLPAANAASSISLEENSRIPVTVQITCDGEVVLEKTDAATAVSFTPQKEGLCLVSYTATDYVGRTKKKEYSINVVKGPVIKVSDVPTEGFEGRKITLPSAEAKLDKKEYPVTVTVYDPRLYPVTVNNRVFTPELSGPYYVKYTCKYGKNQIERIYRINVGVAMEDLFKDTFDVTFTENVDFPEYAVDGNGLLVTAGGDGASATFASPIDLSTLGPDDTLFEFLPVPEKVKSADFRRFYVYLTDVNDPDNRLTISVFQSQWTNPDGSNVWCFAQAGYGTGRLKALNNNGEWVDGKPPMTDGGNVGTMFPGSFSGERTDGMPLKAFRIRYDNEEKQVIMALPGNPDWVVLDLDDPYCMGAGKEWSGFSSNEVWLSFKVAEGQGTAPHFIISNIAGQSLSGSRITDTMPPSIQIKWKNNTETPAALVGSSFTLPEATASDLVSGSVEEVQLVVTDPDGEVVPVENGAIRTDKTGIYRLTYTAVDHSSNTAECTVEVSSYAKLDPLKLEYAGEMPKKAFAGEKIKIPAAAATGGSGYLTVELTVELDGEEIELSEDRRFVPKKAGDYKVVYTVTDYLGQKAVFESLIAVTVSDKPIVEINGVPTAWVSGKTLTFPDFTALDYNVKDGEEPLEAKKSISIEYDGNTVTLGEDRSSLIEVKKSGDVITVIYRAEAVGEGVAGNVLEKRFKISVVKPEQVGDYFIHDTGRVSISYDNDNAYYRLSTGGERLEYVHPLCAEDFLLQMNVRKEYNGIESFDVILQDSVYDEVKVVVKVIKGETDRNCRVQVNGDGPEIAIPGSFYEISGEPIELDFANDTCMLTAYGGFEICQVTKDSEGRTFTGFPSGMVRLSIVFGKVSGKAELSIKKLMNQPFYGKADEQNGMKPFTDVIQPIIYLSDNLPTTVDIDTTVAVPSAVAYDVLSSKAEVQVCVTAPDGSMVVETTSAEENLSFETFVYGTYCITYTTTDDAGNLLSRKYNVRVPDTIPPEIEIAGDVPTRGKKGTPVKLPDASVTDNYDAEVSLEIFVTSPAGHMELLDGNSFIPEQDGEYRILYYAKDGDYSFTSIPFSVIVGEGAFAEIQSGVNLLAIVGGAAVLAVIAALAVLLICRSRRKKKPEKQKEQEG